MHSRAEMVAYKLSDIMLDGITVYGTPSSDRHLLDHINCTFKQGRVTLIAGTVGAGKSTLLDVVGGLVPANEGTVTYGDEPLWQRRGKRLNPRLLSASGIIFQQPEKQLFARTVKEEFAYSLRPLRLSAEEADRRTQKAMRDMGLPDGLITRSPFALSGGQQRRVAIAATLAVQPQWLLLDEPTTGLDGEGIRSLLQSLEKWRNSTGGGIIVASHDLDVFLPIADDVLLLKQGKIVSFCSRDRLCGEPQALLDAGLVPPDSLRVASLLRSRGIDSRPDLLSPSELADVIMKSQRRLSKEQTEQAHLRKSAHTRDHLAGRSGSPVLDLPHADTEPKAARTDTEKTQASDYAQDCVAASGPNHVPSDRSTDQSRILPPSETPNITQNLATEQVIVQTTPRSFLDSADPRALWLFVLLVSISVFLQRHWFGIAVSAAIAALIIAVSRVPLSGIWRAIKAFGLFTLVAMLLSGLRLSFPEGAWYMPHPGFSAQAVSQTMLRLLPILIVLPLGLLLTLTMSHIQIKRGLEQGLSYLKWTRLPIEAFALSVSLLFRFMPLIMSEWERFSRITRARGKTVNRPGTIKVRELRSVALPLLLSLLQLADNVAFAMEMRGYKSIGQRRTSAVALRMKRRDYVLVAAGAGLAALLAAIALSVD